MRPVSAASVSFFRIYCSPAMSVLADMEPGSGQGAGERRLSWPVFLLTLAAVTSSSLSALSLYQLVALRAEVEVLKSDMCRRREEGQEAGHRGQTELISRSSIQEALQRPGSQHLIRKRRTTTGSEMLAPQSCLQLLADDSRNPFSKELPSGTNIGIPWQVGLKRGSALEVDGDQIVVREDGFYFVYSQVFYTDKIFTLGHEVIRWKQDIVGNEEREVHLFRCIQGMSPEAPYNTCYTGGIVKLERGDHLELLIPRSAANISLDGDSTFLGAFKLA